jgi:hypothetical protein
MLLTSGNQRVIEKDLVMSGYQIPKDRATSIGVTFCEFSIAAVSEDQVVASGQNRQVPYGIRLVSVA